MSNMSDGSVLSFLSDLDGDLSKERLLEIFRYATSLHDKATMVETNPGSGQVTCCLALACKGTGRRVCSIWTQDVLNLETAAARQYVVWHQNIIRKHMVPFVTPMPLSDSRCISTLLASASLLIPGNDPQYSTAGLNPVVLNLQTIPPDCKVWTK